MSIGVACYRLGYRMYLLIDLSEYKEIMSVLLESNVELVESSLDFDEGVGRIEIRQITQNLIEHLIEYYDQEDIVIKFIADDLLVSTLKMFDSLGLEVR